jgi:hypothetical protein
MLTPATARQRWLVILNLEMLREANQKAKSLAPSPKWGEGWGEGFPLRPLTPSFSRLPLIPQSRQQPL